MMYYVIKNLDSDEASLVEWPIKPRDEDIIFNSDKKDVAEAFLSGFKTLNNNMFSPIKTSFTAFYNDCFYPFVFSKGEWTLVSFGKSKPADKKVECLKSVTALCCYGAYIPNWEEGQIDYCILPKDGVSILYSSSNIDDVVQFCFAYRHKYFYKNTWHKPLGIDTMESLDGWKFSFANGVWTCDRPVKEDIKASTEIKSIFDPDTVKIEEIKRILSLSLLVSNHTKIAAIKDIINQGE